MVHIHPLAAVSPGAHLGQGVHVGPFSVIEAGASVGDGCRLESHAVVKSGVVMGAENHIFEGAVLGGLPQHLQLDTPGGLIIGSGNAFRENVTVHRALHEENATTIGDGNLLMINTHVAHDCKLGDQAIFANNTMLAGHVTVGDRACLSGAVGVHQHCRIGRLAMVGGQARVIKDVPPMVTVDGGTTTIVGLNLVGLRRAGFDREQVAVLKAAYRLIYRSGLAWEEMLGRLEAEFAVGPAAEFREFFRGGTRGFTPERRPAAAAPATIKLHRGDDEVRAKAG